jgi:hypothetical protein
LGSSSSGPQQPAVVLSTAAQALLSAIGTPGARRDVHELMAAKSLNFPKGSVVVMDRGYIDYREFARWTKTRIFARRG